MDTGAHVTIAKPSVVKEIPALEQPPLEPPLLADGLSQGCFNVWVMEIELGEIIRMDLIRKHNNKLSLLSDDFRAGML